jgi:hypothetical protein
MSRGEGEGGAKKNRLIVVIGSSGDLKTKEIVRICGDRRQAQSAEFNGIGVELSREITGFDGIRQDWYRRLCNEVKILRFG